MKFNDRKRVIGADKLYRNTRKGKLMGVCAGLADFYDVDRNIVRIATILLGWFFTTPVLFLYIIAGLLLSKRPEWSYY
ncbi:MAG: PspC domain-containing protein [Gammaproteobacteria bacterium]|nr:PspC domain-containing protein [Gammaproteobacteria bacterium]NNJ71976.1 PspC domain-containing protein [Enterobacterales bacterium]